MTKFVIVESVLTVLGHYAQTEITPKEIRLFKENSSDFFQVII